MGRRVISIGVAATLVMLLVINVINVRGSRVRPHTYHQAVIEVLEQRAIRYDSVTVIERCQLDPGPCLEQQFSWSFTTISVRIATPDQRTVTGRINCYYYRADCYLSVAGLELINVQLRDLAGVGSRPGAIKRTVEYVRSLLREWKLFLCSDEPGRLCRIFSDNPVPAREG